MDRQCMSAKAEGLEPHTGGAQERGQGFGYVISVLKHYLPPLYLSLTTDIN